MLFAEGYKDAITNIRQLVNQKKYDKVKRHVHSLKGIVGNVSASELYDVICELDLCLQKNDVESLSELIDRSDILLTQAVTRIEALREKDY